MLGSEFCRPNNEFDFFDQLSIGARTINPFQMPAVVESSAGILNQWPPSRDFRALILGGQQAGNWIKNWLFGYSGKLRVKRSSARFGRQEEGEGEEAGRRRARPRAAAAAASTRRRLTAQHRAGQPRVTAKQSGKLTPTINVMSNEPT